MHYCPVCHSPAQKDTGVCTRPSCMAEMLRFHNRRILELTRQVEDLKKVAHEQSVEHNPNP